MVNVGNRVRLTIERPSQGLVKQFFEASPPDLADAMNKTGAMREIAAMYTPIRRCAGPAITVKAPTGDAVMVQKAIEIAQPGDIIVIDGRATISRSLWGGNRSIRSEARGVAGVIIDGGTRDIDETRSVDLPLFARAIAPMASASAGLGELNFPIACGGVVVCPGDIVVADSEGIVVIPREDAEDVYAAWVRIVEREKVWAANAREGKAYVGDVVDRVLRETGAEIIP